MKDLSRYEALLRVCDMACAHASATHADQRPELFETLSVALSDDCPAQSAAAADTARRLRVAVESRDQFLASLHPEPLEGTLAL